MEIFRFKKEKFNLENFIHYYNDNIEELLMEYPHYVSRICLIDRDYMDVIIFDEDYEYLNDAKDYKELLVNGEYALHFAIGKTYENAEKVELIDGSKFVLNHYMEDIYEEDNPDGIIDKLFHTDAEPAVSVESPEVKEEHKVDPDEFALYKKYL